MDYNKIAQDILDNVGGKANVKQVTHCFTRLRFILKDESLAKKDVVEHLEGVISPLYCKCVKYKVLISGQNIWYRKTWYASENFTQKKTQ